MPLADASPPSLSPARNSSANVVSSASEQPEQENMHAGTPDDDRQDVSSGSASDQSDSSVASVQLSMPRRSLQLQFTCGKCGAAFPLCRLVVHLGSVMERHRQQYARPVYEGLQLTHTEAAIMHCNDLMLSM